MSYLEPMTSNASATSQKFDMPLELHKIISRMSCDGGRAGDMSTLGAAAAQIILLEHALGSLLSLMEETPYPELHAAVRNALSLVDRA